MLSLLPAGAFAKATSADATGDPVKGATPFTVSDDTQVPGRTLAPGQYTIRVVDHLSDRMILQVEHNGKTQSTFLALPSSKLSKSTSGPITLAGGPGAKSAMRGYSFPDGTVAEFVFPKAEAVGLAKANSTTIPAIDPASEGITTSASTLSKTDREMVTLWMLSPTQVGPNDTGPGIKAVKYQQDASLQTASRPAPTHTRARPLMTSLPHTASEAPLLWLVGLISTLFAAMLMRRRLASAC